MCVCVPVTARTGTRMLHLCKGTQASTPGPHCARVLLRGEERGHGRRGSREPAPRELHLQVGLGLGGWSPSPTLALPLPL